ncbi:hypothetical protein CCP3SC15_2150002 [Gammaproteobacteria bacterium]
MKLQGVRNLTGELVTFELDDIVIANKENDNVEIVLPSGRSTILSYSSIVPIPAPDPAWVELAEMAVDDDPMLTQPLAKRAAELLAEMEVK